MADTLKKLGFRRSSSASTSTRKNFANTIESFARALDGAEVGLFFYGGPRSAAE